MGYYSQKIIFFEVTMKDLVFIFAIVVTVAMASMLKTERNYSSPIDSKGEQKYISFNH